MVFSGYNVNFNLNPINIRFGKMEVKEFISWSSDGLDGALHVQEGNLNRNEK